MIILYFILVTLTILSVKPTHGSWNANYISRDTTNVIKGICIWLVFIRHINSYLCSISGLNHWDLLTFEIDNHLRQLLVVPFLFYSGYGVTLAMINKGSEYVNKIPTKRIFATLCYFDIAVVIFLIMNLCLGFELSLSKIILSFVGWDSIRNSNWYIFCIIFCYIISYVSYKLAKEKSTYVILYVCIGILLYTAILYFFKGHWWYDTIYAYGAGTVFAYNKNRIESFVKNHYSTTLVISIIGFMCFYNAPNYFSIAADITAVFLCMLLILFTSKFVLQSRVLSWSGNHLFALYISASTYGNIINNIWGRNRNRTSLSIYN